MTRYILSFYLHIKHILELGRTKGSRFITLNATGYTIYLTIIRRRRSECWGIFPETKSRGIFTNIHEPEANNCFSIITQVIIEIPKQRNATILPQFAIVDESSYQAARIDVSRNAFLRVCLLVEGRGSRVEGRGSRVEGN